MTRATVRVLAHQDAMTRQGLAPASGKIPRGFGHPAGERDYPMTQLQILAAAPVYYATSLGHLGLQTAVNVVHHLPLALAQMQSLWPGLAIPECPCLISPLSEASDGAGGAYHYSCLGTDCYCDCCTRDDGTTTLALYLAEVSEVCQAVQDKGWDCGSSNGEALSRVQASYLCPSVLDDYATFPAWLESRRENWIDRTDPTDQDALSTGCGVGFLWWLASIGYSLPDIASAGGTTLAETFSRLRPAGEAWHYFKWAVEQQWPVGRPSGVTRDNPWFTPPPPAATLVI